MKIPINLASRPYENLRPFYTGAAIALALLVVLSLAVIITARHNRNATLMLTQQRDRFDRDLVGLRKEEGELSGWLARPEVQEIRDRSTYLNSLIVRKSLSWTRIFMDLEKVLPNQVQVSSIRPTAGDSAEAKLLLSVSAPTLTPLIDFLKKLESSPEFEKPEVSAQHFPEDKATDPNITVELSVIYRQSADAPAAPRGEQDAPAAELTPQQPDAPVDEQSMHRAMGMPGKPPAALADSTTGPNQRQAR